MANMDFDFFLLLFGDPFNYTFITFESEWAQFVNDIDGTLTGYADHTLVSDHPMMLDSRCVKAVGSNFGYLLFSLPLSQSPSFIFIYFLITF
jgi:hypothetical protein